MNISNYYSLFFLSFRANSLLYTVWGQGYMFIVLWLEGCGRQGHATLCFQKLRQIRFEFLADDSWVSFATNDLGENTCLLDCMLMLIHMATGEIPLKDFPNATPATTIPWKGGQVRGFVCGFFNFLTRVTFYIGYGTDMTFIVSSVSLCHGLF